MEGPRALAHRGPGKPFQRPHLTTERRPARVRLVSKSGRFLLVNEPSVFGDVNKWGWVESKWFFPPLPRGLCGGKTPFTATGHRRENWPPICRRNGYNVG